MFYTFRVQIEFLWSVAESVISVIIPTVSNNGRIFFKDSMIFFLLLTIINVFFFLPLFFSCSFRAGRILAT
ncbi:hypothetical protein C2G38_2118655 [Gigaspora rosea]|uniref:Uncharacterized protein n=1 Tax=Gigaspora rosea TaxID=44941 RepID=A0A397U514_9GLOM|nr:hypothetical protein C2G38_2118655 [Gigaspora rosea]